MTSRRITQEERAELVNAIQKGEVDRNVSAYATTYATEHGLKPNTVRSALTRLRKEVGSSRHPGGDEWAATTSAILLTEADPSSVAKIGAAALIRYGLDNEFKRAVDLERADLEKIYEAVDNLRNVTQALGEEERETILRSLLQGAK